MVATVLPEARTLDKDPAVVMLPLEESLAATVAGRIWGEIAWADTVQLGVL